MPIRFRCPHCHQLLGIARRKAGSMVHCPTCNTPVAVPASDVPDNPEEAAAAGLPPAPAPQSGGLFDRDDFDALLRGSTSGAIEQHKSIPDSVHTAAPPHPAPEEASPLPPLPAGGEMPAPEMVPAPLIFDPRVRPGVAQHLLAPPVGLVLSPGKATVLTVIVILLLAIAFGTGLIVGRFYL
jgi:hypothetical protein